MTRASDVHALLDVIAEVTPTCIVGGGWGVDALVGRVTRPHQDLDVLLPEEALSAVVAALHERGFETVTDWLPVRVELARGDVRIDLHPIHPDPIPADSSDPTSSDPNSGDRTGGDPTAQRGWWQHSLTDLPYTYPLDQITTGTIAGRTVTCLDHRRQLEAHLGYEPRPQDLADLAVLRSVASS